jgi:hypothetical protein
MNPAVKVNSNMNRTGAVDKYFEDFPWEFNLNK